ncbi:MAG: HNH endonuclease [Janthinobacterium lividum]
MTYEAYIASPAWKALRLLALARDGHRCRLCDAGDDLEVHHRRYPPGGRWKLDCLEALTTLCAPCHERTTCELRGRRYASQALPRLGNVIRLTTIGGQGGLCERLPDIALQDHRRVTPADAQRPAGRPAKPARQEHRPGRRQAAQDRG